MSKISIVFLRSSYAERQGVILVSVFLLALGLLQGCGNKGDLYRESDAVALDSIQEAADKLRQREDDADADDEEKKEDKAAKKSKLESDRKSDVQAGSAD